MYGQTTKMIEAPLQRSDAYALLSAQAETPLQHTYEIESEIGAGGCGAVYKAWHKRLQKHIVLKQLKDSTNRAAQVRRNEIEALKNIKSMYIPQVFDFLTEENSSYTVMEYIDGVSFDKLLAEGRMFSAAQITKWYYQLASALETLHSKDVCHRDIKPANIILTKEGNVCLIDFGSALVSGNYTGLVSRSIGYASPEQLEYFQLCRDFFNASRVSEGRGRDIDWKLSDIYSLGATMYHLLTGAYPPQQRYETDLPPHICAAAGSPAEAIKRSMSVNPARRYQSARELRRALLPKFRAEL